MVLAATFILSGFVKAVDPLGTQYKISDYLEAANMGGLLPDWATLGVSVLLSAAEFCLGVFLLFAVQRRLTSRLILLMMAVMTPLTLWLALANPISDCGCFGDAVVLTNWQTFWKNILLLGCAVVVAWWPKDMFRFVSESNQWIVINYSALFILGIAAENHLTLSDEDMYLFTHLNESAEVLKREWNRRSATVKIVVRDHSLFAPHHAIAVRLNFNPVEPFFTSDVRHTGRIPLDAIMHFDDFHLAVSEEDQQGTRPFLLR